MTTVSAPVYGLNAAGRPMTQECIDHHGHEGCCSHCMPRMFTLTCVDHVAWKRRESRRIRMYER